jgi:hypothetical protein
VKRSTTQVAAAVAEVAAVAAVDDEDGVQWRRWGGHSMAAAAFDGGGNELRIGNVEAKMAIDTSGGRWFKAKMAIDTSGMMGGDSGHQRLTAAMDEGGHLRLTVASVDNRYGIQWHWWRWCLMVEAAFDGVRWRWRWTTER